MAYLTSYPGYPAPSTHYGAYPSPHPFGYGAPHGAYGNFGPPGAYAPASPYGYGYAGGPPPPYGAPVPSMPPFGLPEAFQHMNGMLASRPDALQHIPLANKLFGIVAGNLSQPPEALFSTLYQVALQEAHALA
jgi:hypothetical protein